MGLIVAAWCLAGYPYGTTTRGVAAWCAIMDRSPRDPLQPSIAERDLGNRVYGCFTVFRRGLWIHNFVSQSHRRHGHARASLRAICQIADEFGSEIYGKVEPNNAGGLEDGASFEKLMRWYAREGFRPLPFTGNVFDSLSEAREEIERWRIDYNADRPHRALGQQTPEGLARSLAQTTTLPRNVA